MYLRNVSPFGFSSDLRPSRRIIESPNGGRGARIRFSTRTLFVEQVVDDVGLVQVYDPTILGSWPLGQPFFLAQVLVRFSLPG